MTSQELRNSPIGRPTRRTFVKGPALGSGAAALGFWRTPAFAFAQGNPPAAWTTLAGSEFDLRIGETPMNFTGSPRMAFTVNGSVPAPTLRWKEGDRHAPRGEHARRGRVDSLARHHPPREHGWRARPELPRYSSG